MIAIAAVAVVAALATVVRRCLSTGRDHRPSHQTAVALHGAVDEAGILVFFGTIDAGTLDVFRERLRDAPRPLRVDLALVDHLDAAGVHALIQIDDIERLASGTGVELTAVTEGIGRALSEAGAQHLVSGAGESLRGSSLVAPPTDRVRSAGR